MPGPLSQVARLDRADQIRGPIAFVADVPLKSVEIELRVDRGRALGRQPEMLCPAVLDYDNVRRVKGPGKGPEFEWTQSARRHRIGRAHVRRVIDAITPNEGRRAGADREPVWYGRDDRGVWLTVVGPRSGREWS